MTTTPLTPKPPTQEQMILRARWLRSLSPDERDHLDELPLREVDRRFEEWCARGRDPGPDARPRR